jgi:hypothetical protein
MLDMEDRFALLNRCLYIPSFIVPLEPSPQVGWATARLSLVTQQYSIFGAGRRLEAL